MPIDEDDSDCVGSYPVDGLNGIAPMILHFHFRSHYGGSVRACCFKWVSLKVSAIFWCLTARVPYLLRHLDLPRFTHRVYDPTIWSGPLLRSLPGQQRAIPGVNGSKPNASTHPAIQYLSRHLNFSFPSLAHTDYCDNNFCDLPDHHHVVQLGFDFHRS